MRPHCRSPCSAGSELQAEHNAGDVIVAAACKGRIRQLLGGLLGILHMSANMVHPCPPKREPSLSQAVGQSTSLVAGTPNIQKDEASSYLLAKPA